MLFELVFGTIKMLKLYLKPGYNTSPDMQNVGK